jgi:RNA polymerase sigma factor (sigma-70 family)
MQLGQRAQAALDANAAGTASLLYARKELRTHASEGEAAKTTLVSGYIRLFKLMAYKEMQYHPMADLTVSELVDEGCIGLVTGLNKFDLGRDVNVSTYVTWWVRQAIQRALEDQGSAVRLPVHVYSTFRDIRKTRAKLFAELGRQASVEETAMAMGWSPDKMIAFFESTGRSHPTSLDEQLYDDSDDSAGDFVADESMSGRNPADVVIQHIERARLHQFVDRLPSNQKDIIVRSFGLNNRDPQTFTTIALAQGVGRDVIRFAYNRALNHLRGLYLADAKILGATPSGRMKRPAA